MFVIHNDLHAEQLGPLGTRDEAMAELRRLASIPWAKPPNVPLHQLEDVRSELRNHRVRRIAGALACAWASGDAGSLRCELVGRKRRISPRRGTRKST